MFKSSDFKESKGGNGMSKIIGPGTHYCRIVDMVLEAPGYNKDAYFVTLRLEGVDKGDEFEGLAVDKNNPSLGNYRGQVGNVKSGDWPYSTYTYEGKVIERDNQIYNWVNNLAKQMGILHKMNEKGVEGDTIEEYVSEVRKYLIDPELWGHFTIAGSEYFNEGYTTPNYRLSFPKAQPRKNLFPFSALENDDRKPHNFMEFDETVHITKAKEKVEDKEPLTSFEPTKSAAASSNTIADDFPKAGSVPMSDIDLPFGN
jgi:hypothetical protein